jgi:16S rRNA G966 N2-methylase RsmD
VLHDFGHRTHLLTDGGVLVVEHHTKKQIPDEVGALRRWRVLKQGETSLSFYENA